MPKKGSKKSKTVPAELVREMAALLLKEKQCPTAQPKKRRRRNRRRAGAPSAELPTGVIRNPGVAPVTVTGEDFLEDISLSSSTEDGAVLLTLPLHPPDWGGTHAASLLRSYERYRLRSLEVHVSTRASKVIGGGYLAGISQDATRGILGGKSRARQAKAAVKALAGSVSSPLAESVRVIMPPGNNPQVWRYVNSDDTDLASYGNFYLVVDGAPNFVQGLTVATLSVSLKWSLELASPTTEAMASGAQAVVIPKGERLGKSAESAFLADPHNPYNASWWAAANAFNFGSVIAISPPITRGTRTFKDTEGKEFSAANFARLSWHSQKDQLRFAFYSDAAAALADPEPGPEGAAGRLQFTGEDLDPAHDLYLSEVAVAWKKSSSVAAAPRGGKARLLVNARAPMLEDQGGKSLLRLQSIKEAVADLQGAVREIYQHIEQQPYGTLTSPIFTVMAPVPARAEDPQGPSADTSSEVSEFEQVDI